MQLSSLTLNQLSTWFSNDKQTIFKLHSVKSNPSFDSHQTEKLHSLLSCNFAFLLDFEKPSKTTRNPCILHHLDHIVKHFEPLNPNWKLLSSFCFHQGPNMANRDSVNSKHSWAEQASSSFIIKHCLLLFALLSSKTALFPILLQNQVSNQPPSFALLCYACERSLNADSKMLCLAWNVALIMEKSEFLILCPNAFLLDWPCLL